MMEGFEQMNDMCGIIFRKDLSSCCVRIGDMGCRAEARRLVGLFLVM
jgi:hypothetical protein